MRRGLFDLTMPKYVPHLPSAKRLTVAPFQVDNYTVADIQEPPSSRLLDDEGEEVAFRIRGIICMKELPPVPETMYVLE
jgi:hypothetical protein